MLLPPRAQYTRRRERKQGGPRAHHHWPPRPLPGEQRTGPQTRYRWTPATRIFTEDLTSRIVTASRPLLGRTDVPNEDVRSAWTHLEQLLAERVGGRLSAGISQAEFDEFNGLNEDAGTRWLRLHVPDYQAIVRAEIATLTRQAATWFTSHFPANSDPEEHRDVEAA